MKHFLLLAFALLIWSAASAQETERRFVYFGYNDTTLSAQGKADIDEMVRLAGNRKILKVEVYTHTDNRGDADKNMILAQQRGNVIRRYLIASGVTSAYIIVEAFGEQNPAFSNDTEKGQAKNRRAEVVFTYGAIPDIAGDDIVLRTPLPAEEPKPVSVAGALPSAADTQRFTVDAGKDILIKGKQGTEIRWQKNSFTDKNCKVITGEIEFQLIECYKKSDMVRYGLSTTSNGKLLESGGMIYIAATCNGDSAFFSAKPWTFEIAFPTSDKKSDMGMFYADSVLGPSNWIPAERNFYGDYAYVKNMDALNQYVFNSTQMGWINCDRFTGDKKLKLTTVSIDMTDTAGVSFALVFKDINSAMAAGGGNGPVQFINVPVGYEVTLIAFRKTGETYSYYSQDFTVEKNHRQTVTLENLSEKEFNTRLKSLD